MASFGTVPRRPDHFSATLVGSTKFQLPRPLLILKLRSWIFHRFRSLLAGRIMHEICAQLEAVVCCGPNSNTRAASKQGSCISVLFALLFPTAQSIRSESRMRKKMIQLESTAPTYNITYFFLFSNRLSDCSMSASLITVNCVNTKAISV